MPYVLGILLIALLGSGIGNLLQHNANSVLRIERDTALEAESVAQQNSKTNKTSADKWEKVAGELNSDLAQCNATQEKIKDENRAAVAKAQTGARDAAERLRQFRVKYDAASKDATCAALLDLPLCEELQ